MQAALALGASAFWPANRARAFASQRLTQDDLLAFEPLGQVTLLHVTDLHAQLRPLWYREPATHVGAGEDAGLPPHLAGRALLEAYAIEPGSALAYTLVADDFSALAKAYGRVGGLDRLASIVHAIRATRPQRTLLLDGGDTWQGSYTALASRGADMCEAMRLLGVEAMTAHWEFTYGEQRVRELVDGLGFPFLAANVFDTEWDEPVFAAHAHFERGGIPIAVIGQAFPYTPIANPRWQMPTWSFGVREESLRGQVAAARAAGARLVVLLSHNGFDVDRKLAARVPGLDVILTGHTHDALPAVLPVGRTLLVASGSHGKFLSRLDLDIGSDGVRDFRYRLIPIFADAIAPDPDMAKLIERVRAPHAAMLDEVLGRTRSLLYRRGTLNGTYDDLIVDALRATQDAEIALSPGFRWGGALLPDSAITREDIYNQTAITYPAVYRTTMTGAAIKAILEDVADNLCHPDPYYRQGGDMVRVGGLAFTLRVAGATGQRIEDLRRWPDGAPIAAAKSYTVAGWASVNEGVSGTPVYDVVADYVRAREEIELAPHAGMKLI